MVRWIDTGACQQVEGLEQGTLLRAQKCVALNCDATHQNAVAILRSILDFTATQCPHPLLLVGVCRTPTILGRQVPSFEAALDPAERWVALDLKGGTADKLQRCCCRRPHRTAAARPPPLLPAVIGAAAPQGHGCG